jgi:hypothetical protein
VVRYLLASGELTFVANEVMRMVLADRGVLPKVIDVYFTLVLLPGSIYYAPGCRFAKLPVSVIKEPKSPPRRITITNTGPCPHPGSRIPSGYA